jgi:hypothetical protein
MKNFKITTVTTTTVSVRLSIDKKVMPKEKSLIIGRKKAL